MIEKTLATDTDETETPERGERMLTLKEVAGRTGLSKRRLQELIAAGQITSELKKAEFGTEYRVVAESEVLRLLEARTVQRATQTGRGRRPKLPDQAN